MPSAGVTDGRPTAVVVQQGEATLATWTSSAGGGAGGSSWTCWYHPLITDGGSSFTVDYASTPVLEDGQVYALTCWGDDGQLTYQQIVAWDPADPLAGVAAEERAAEQALAAVDLPAPPIGTSPAPGAEHLVGLPTWLWVEAWAPVAATATLGTVSATATATPTQVTWDLGDGATLTCDGPGTPWAPDATSDCTHTWTDRSSDRPGGAFTLTATTTWSVTWAATTGAAGDLGTLTSTSATPVVVVEAQAVVRR